MFNSLSHQDITENGLSIFEPSTQEVHQELSKTPEQLDSEYALDALEDLEASKHIASYALADGDFLREEVVNIYEEMDNLREGIDYEPRLNPGGGAYNIEDER